MDKQNGICLYMEYYSARKRDEVLIMCYNMDEPWKLKWNKPGTKKTNTVGFHFYEISRIGKFTETEIGLMVMGTGIGEMRSG